MNTERKLLEKAASTFQTILMGLPGMQVKVRFVEQSSDQAEDLIVEMIHGAATIRFAVDVKSRITPQVALSACSKFRRAEGIPALFAPVISARVAEIIRGQNVCYVDGAGNCWLYSPSERLLIERVGFRGERAATPPATDLFATRSSRIVRAMLSRPNEGWQVRQLADHPEVKVSPGLVVKVKRALIEEGYAIENDRKLYLRDPSGLLKAWCEKYVGPLEEVPLYFRGDVAAAEEAVCRSCRELSFHHALGGFSAAWRLAPEVRYQVATVYVDDPGFLSLDELISRSGGKRIDTGPNLILWRPYDRSVFASNTDGAMPTTAPLQTYLDLKRARGRGEEASKAIFDKYLGGEFERAVKGEEERHRGKP